MNLNINAFDAAVPCSKKQAIGNSSEKNMGVSAIPFSPRQTRGQSKPAGGRSTTLRLFYLPPFLLPKINDSSVAKCKL